MFAVIFQSLPVRCVIFLLGMRGEGLIGDSQ